MPPISLEHLSLTTALAVAVVWLWKAYTDKVKQVELLLASVIPVLTLAEKALEGYERLLSNRESAK